MSLSLCLLEIKLLKTFAYKSLKGLLFLFLLGTFLGERWLCLRVRAYLVFQETKTGDTLDISKNRKLLLPLGLEGGDGVTGAQGLRAPGRSWNYSFLSLVQGKLLLPRNPTLSDSRPNQNRKERKTLPLPFSPH